MNDMDKRHQDQGSSQAYRKSRRRYLAQMLIVQISAMLAVSFGVLMVLMPNFVPALREFYEDIIGPSTAISAMVPMIGMVVVSMTFFLFAEKRRRRLPRVFVSFSHKDKKFVDDLVARLRDRGVRIATADETIRVGDSIKQRIRELVESSSHAIVVVTPDYEESQWAAIELAMLKSPIKVLPLLHKTEKLPPGLEDIRALEVPELSDSVVDSLMPALPLEDDE